MTTEIPRDAAERIITDSRVRQLKRDRSAILHDMDDLNADFRADWAKLQAKLDEVDRGLALYPQPAAEA